MAKKIIIVLVAAATFVIAGLAYINLRPHQAINVQTVVATTTSQVQTSGSTISSTSSQAVLLNNHPGMKLYRNDQFRFEFWYPEGWVLQENVFGSPYSKFNLTVMKINGQNTDQNDVLNIVTAAFESNAVSNYQAMKAVKSNILIDGVPVTKYRYNFEGLTNIDADIPLGDYRILFGVESAHEAEFNKILSSFKFMK